MTRINVVPVKELSDQHLIAEYHELPRVIKQDINIKGAPDRYCLGKGHMKWARKHWNYCLLRYFDLINEMLYRDFKITYDWVFLRSWCLDYPKRIGDGTYKVQDEDIELSRQRLIEKYRMKPNWYRWTKREKPKYMEELV